MHRIILFLVLITFWSCSIKEKNDLESMNLKGQVRGFCEKRFSNEGSIELEINYVFDSAGKLLSITHYYPYKQINFKTTNHYNFWGKLIEQNFFESDSVVLKQLITKIDNTKDSILAYDSKGCLVNTGILKYNEERKVIESILYDTINSVIHSESSFYNANGKLIENRISSCDSTINGTIYKYSYDSLKRMRSFAVKNTITGYMKKELYRYETDLFENWIKKNVETKNGDQIGFITREIKYK